VRAAPPDIDDGALVAALRDGWGFGAEALEYEAVGGGSHHWHVADATGTRRFVTVDDLGHKPWLGDVRDDTFAGLDDAFATARALHDRGLEFVAAPLPTRDGGVLRRLDARYALSLFPFLGGTAGPFGRYEHDDDRRSVVSMLAALHQVPVDSVPRVRSAGPALPGRRHLEAALRDRDEPWTAGPLSEPARRAVQQAAGELAELLARADRLAGEAAARDGRWVVTHGEPHPANVVRDGDERFLVDWDTVALAPPERDLWLVVDDGTDAGDAYAQATGRRIDAAALDYFRLMWGLKDLAEYLNVLRSPHEENEDTVRQYRALLSVRPRASPLRPRFRAPRSG
jgi:spectinomycin phosphotransferase